jgi:hypothetical protein
MIAYNQTLLNNLRIHKVAKRWFANELISAEQMGKVITNYKTDHFKPNVFIKIGLFIFSFFIIGAALGLYSLFTMALLYNSNGDGIVAYSIVACVLFGTACFFFLEKFIQWRNWYSNGMDDALLYNGLGFLLSIIIFSMSNNLNDEDAFLIVCMVYLPFLTAAVIRYADRVVTIAAVVCSYMIFFLIVMKTGSTAKFVMPFAFMALSGIYYFAARKMLVTPSAVNYKGCLTVLKTISLIVFYISGNYFVIRECSIEFFRLELGPGQDIPMAFIFYIFTALVPLAYLFFGLKRKDKLMVWVALLLTAAAVLTFKYYFSLGHPEVTLTIAGLVMMGVAYGSIKYLATDKYGITFKDDPNEDNFLKSNAEALVIAQSFSQAPVQSADSGVQMGGGEFGGGGSGNKF